MSQIYCKKCGKAVIGNAKFCTSCGTPMENDYATDSEKLNAANIKAQASPVKGEGTMKKNSTVDTVAYTVFSIICIVFAALICVIADPWNGMSMASLGFVITFGFLAVVLQLISIGKVIRRMQ